MEIKYGGARNTKLSKPLGYPDPQNKHIMQQQNKHNNKTSIKTKQAAQYRSLPSLSMNLFCYFVANFQIVQM